MKKRFILGLILSSALSASSFAETKSLIECVQNDLGLDGPRLTYTLVQSHRGKFGLVKEIFGYDRITAREYRSKGLYQGGLNCKLPGDSRFTCLKGDLNSDGPVVFLGLKKNSNDPFYSLVERGLTPEQTNPQEMKEYSRTLASRLTCQTLGVAEVVERFGPGLGL